MKVKTAMFCPPLPLPKFVKEGKAKNLKLSLFVCSFFFKAFKLLVTYCKM